MASPPASTYRVQLHAGFGFDRAGELADYLARLGISHVYCSPILAAAPGSTHGYDVVDHSRINPELGGRAGFERLSHRLAEAGIGMVVDIVPNHMATAGRANAWWWDVLENGPSSLYAGHFDIDWDPPETRLRQKVLVPILGDHYGRVLERGEIRLERREGRFRIAYFDHELPVSPRTLDEVLSQAGACAAEDADELVSLAHAFGRLPHASATDRASVEERHRDKEVLAERLGRLISDRQDLGAAVDAALERFNADHDRLDTFLQRQNYRLAYWRVAGQEMDYRRFFDIPGLIGIRVEDVRVFQESHSLVLDLVDRGLVHGLRIDHPDGLRDPKTYLDRLSRASKGVWVVVEKILEDQEELRPDWRTDGTTGYDFLNVAGGLFVDPRGEPALTELYRRHLGEDQSYAETALLAKREVMATSLAADVERLAALLVEVCELRRRFRDFTRMELRAVVQEVLAALGVYRTYVEASGRSAAEDRAEVKAAIALARQRRDDLDHELFDLLSEILTGAARAPVEVELGQRFQQLSGPVMAKGVEDTAFYRYVRLLALNEVGGDPGRFGRTPEEFHEHNRRIQDRWPATMLASSTHDTKRSEDVRARLALLSEIPEEWERTVSRWSALTDRHRPGGQAADPRADYVLFQTLVGAHPVSVDRVQEFMLKAVREAKLRTSWTDSGGAYESGLRELISGLMADPEMKEELEAFVGPLVGPGRVNSLAQQTLKLTSPGVPDIYQGTESWSLSLVDPDNRRPVDFARLSALLDEVPGMTAEEALARDDEGLPKLLVTQRLLELRGARPRTFGPEGTYDTLWPTGPRAGHAVAYRRGQEVVTVVPRLVIGLERAGGWADTSLTLPEGHWEDVFTRKSWTANVAFEELLGRFPVSVLVRS